MIGAIVGDIVGSVYEFNNIRTKQFPLITKQNHYTDDTIMTIAIMEWLLNTNSSVVKCLQKWGRKYKSSYGSTFNWWLNQDNPEPYWSFGNGAAMRISATAYAAKNMAELKSLVFRATAVTHDHPEGIKGALVTATCIFLALHKASKEKIKEYAISQYPEIEYMNYEWLRRNYLFDESCQNTVPQAIYCFLISDSFEDCIRTTISIGGDCDTTAAISGAIADAYYGIPKNIQDVCLSKLPLDMKQVIKKFADKLNKEQKN